MLAMAQIEETDTKALMELFADAAFADLEAESGYNLTEANLLKVRCESTPPTPSISKCKCTAVLNSTFSICSKDIHPTMPPKTRAINH